MLQDSTPEVEAHLSEGMRTGYIGFDPTAPSLTIGNFVQLMILRFFQDAGHRPIILMGGATGRIGDPSGKDQERQLKSFEELDSNLEFQKKQMLKFLNFESGTNKAQLVNNHDFYKNMDILTFLRDVGKTLTVNYMLSKDSVKNRLETGISFTEFSYQLLQAYDFQCLFKDHGCTLQMGGSDQWGNITSGTEFIRRNLSEKAYAVTTPLLTKADGSKFGKSTKGNIWLDPKLTSPYKFYQFWLNADDADIQKFFRYFSLKTREEIIALETEHADNPRRLKELLAEELTIRVHSTEDYDAVQQVSSILFKRGGDEAYVRSLSAGVLETIGEEIPKKQIAPFGESLNIVDLLTENTDILSSKAEAKRAIKNNAISVNKHKIGSDEATIKTTDLLHHRFLLIENGKKNKYLIEVG